MPASAGQVLPTQYRGDGLGGGGESLTDILTPGSATHIIVHFTLHFMAIHTMARVMSRPMDIRGRRRLAEHSKRNKGMERR